MLNQDSRLIKKIIYFGVLFIFLSFLSKTAYADMPNPGPQITIKTSQPKEELIFCGQIIIYGNDLDKEEIKEKGGKKIDDSWECSRLSEENNSFIANPFENQKLTFFSSDFKESWQSEPISAEELTDYVYNLELTEKGRAELIIISIDKREPYNPSPVPFQIWTWPLVIGIAFGVLAICLLVIFLIIYFVSKKKKG